ncbi:membrane protein [Staphylococcus saccharolyticus]|uniref:Membrane protein n=2 Tax=Staphylococcus saccharolyticus TaxID=33028 RepID=A0A380H0A0_9STAP|nr:membrane protein [Staphylococcus saccharolyticus]
MPHWPSLMIPRLVAILGIISVLITIKDKKINSMLKLGGMMINILPLLGSFITKY